MSTVSVTPLPPVSLPLPSIVTAVAAPHIAIATPKCHIDALHEVELQLVLQQLDNRSRLVAARVSKRISDGSRTLATR